MNGGNTVRSNDSFANKKNDAFKIDIKICCCIPLAHVRFAGRA